MHPAMVQPAARGNLDTHRLRSLSLLLLPLSQADARAAAVLLDELHAGRFRTASIAINVSSSPMNFPVSILVIVLR